jgi:hypothetical protein
MPTAIAAEAGEMVGIRSEVGDAGIDYSAGWLHQRGQAGSATHLAWGVDNEPHSIRDQISKLTGIA